MSVESHKHIPNRKVTTHHGGTTLEGPGKTYTYMCAYTKTSTSTYIYTYIRIHVYTYTYILHVYIYYMYMYISPKPATWQPTYIRGPRAESKLFGQEKEAVLSDERREEGKLYRIELGFQDCFLSQAYNHTPFQQA